ncbi:ATP dependent DNA ligase [Paenibacillus terrae HPL-003]|uniref:DNA ligase (ATP) n=1 Tax=Paenibacillus terrae (strain HPL-003) TaxID=985665 RepID=G7W1T8_PAETH|nr:RNA ligase family protein [Paenibacillus terrae]AET58637.1 ATP dependent DNA ligase [Paenibacillus terrae HPL-003]
MELEPIIPFEPARMQNLPSGTNWVAQVKWDGVRILHYCDGNESRLFNRKLNERTLQYPELLDTNSFCKAGSVILDGEVIAFDNTKPSFHEVMKRDRLKQEQSIKHSLNITPVTYMIFDILFYNGTWVTDKSLEFRQQLLDQIIVPRNNIQIVQNFSDGTALFNLMGQYQMEGVVYKDISSKYRINGKDARWRKHKIVNDLFAVVGGITRSNHIVNSLLLGLYTDEDDFIYIGSAGTGKLTRHDWAFLTEQTNKIVSTKCPFSNDPEKSKDVIWVKPELTVKVEYLEFTSGGTMRHPSIQTIIDVDKNECTINQILK